MMDWPCETCKSPVCKGKRINVGFSVSNEDWEAVRGDDQSCWCLTCFDLLAQHKKVRYTILDVSPLTWWQANE